MLPSEIGERSEAAVLAALVEAGKQVLIPFRQTRYDLAYEENGRLVRVQCKTGVLTRGAIWVKTHSRGRSRWLDYRDDADYFGVYCHERREVYLVPVADLPVRGGHLRLEPPKNRQKAGIRWAAPYLVSARPHEPVQVPSPDAARHPDQLILTDVDISARLPWMATLTMTQAMELPVLCCAPLAASSISEDEAQATAELFKALADPHRVKIVNLLATAGEPVCVCDINAEVDLSQPTISFHLKKLAGAGLLTREQRGTWAYYSLDDTAMKKLGSIVQIKKGS